MNQIAAHIQRLTSEVRVASQLPECQTKIVSIIRGMMLVDWAGLFIVNDDQSMKLVAEQSGCGVHGIADCVIEPDCPWLGKVALQQVTVNSRYYAGEEELPWISSGLPQATGSLLVVPVVSRGEVCAVLVLLNAGEAEFSDVEESLMVTVAINLGSLTRYFIPKRKQQVEESDDGWLQGLKGASGLAVGRVVRLAHGKELLSVVDQSCEDVEAELARFEAALEFVDHELDVGRTLLHTGNGDDIQGVFEVYQMVLRSREFATAIRSMIREGFAVETALRTVVVKLAAKFESLDDPYLQSRAEDIYSIGNQLYRQICEGQHPVIQAGEPVILVGSLIGISDIASYVKSGLVGLLSKDGAAMSHVALLAKALGIPAVMGLDLMPQIRDGELIIIDGSKGRLQVNPTEGLLLECRSNIERDRALRSEFDAIKDLPAMAKDQQQVTLMANTGLLSDIEPGLLSGAEGVGLFRSEIPFLERETFPSEREQVEFYRRVLAAYHGKPVYIRTLDAGGDKPLPYYSVEEENPALGWRGIRFSIDNSGLLMTQVRAMLKASEGNENLAIMLPMVSSISEFDQFSKVLDTAYAQCQAEGLELKFPEVGVMVEVPGMLALLPFLKGRVQFLSVGSNDLTQYLLAVDRNNPRVAGLFDHLHPSVLMAIREIVKMGDEMDVSVCVCGEMASDPYSVVALLGCGVRRLSMAAYSLPRIKSLVRSISISDAERLMDALATEACPERIRVAIREFMVDHGCAEYLFN